jgi:O-acetyl-ADP-ribose deacetylase (regulator of RNase III)
MTGPISAAVRRRAGDEVERSAVAQGPIAAGGVVVTNGGRLPVTYLIHAVGVGHDLRADAGRLRAAIESALATVERMALRRIAVAPLGTERGVFPPLEAATMLFETLREHLEGGRSSLESIVVALPRSEEAREYRAALTTLEAAPVPERGAAAEGQ